ncbi:hypothetical protein [Hymenobacter metallilatus]|uniref:Uncharacterized protein n=1 Tax=Hymenobacter metallilatus TaxID=2493666 RepID=A0A3R9M542_9BACT|nr:hypothetical protein [Hymenobacter metallilatus]RSK37358.1 hypothetical protein EI290_01515 [Hymenobacter metallilatus]
MKIYVYTLALPVLLWLGTAEETSAQQTTSAGRAKAAYHRTATPRTKTRAGAYARHDRSSRRDEENLKLAPGFRLNMPSPPTTDYMGRPLKKKPAKTTSATTMSAGEAIGAGKTARRP